MSSKLLLSSFVFLIFFQAEIGFAVPKQVKTSITLEQIKVVYKKKNFNQTIELSKEYLKIFPQDIDASLYEGLAYRQLNQCNKAISVFKSILNTHPQYLEARLGLINCLLKGNNYSQTLEVVEQGLSLNPHHHELLFLKAKTLFLLNRKQEAATVLNQNLKINPKDEQSITLLRNMKEEEYNKNTELFSQRISATPKRVMSVGRKNLELVTDEIKRPKFIIGVFTDNMGVNIPRQYWNLSNFYGYWVTSLGAFGGSVNYATRYNQNATQLELDAAPNLGKYLTLDLTYAYADKPELFPNELESAELHAYLPYEIDGSFGGAHRKIAHFTLDSVTGSINKFIGNYYLNFRPIHFIPGSGPTSTLYRFGIRRYGEDPNQYIGFIYMDGTSPDLTDLLSVDFIKIKDRLFLIEV
ncbi:YaiO family outer membrane beta-barrel protein [Legionella norrlandica]|uniref:YaiO family outer membrane beta-barrel protein n=1 Tax=Legionella norrlandica TaxID=1498499 RepID=UPI000ACB03A3|nr:YaiO family outer membrane beta-barrel protein [Legionella norrlandica]